MKYLAASLSLLTILSLDLILLLGAAVHDPQSVRPYFDALVAVMDLSLVASSGLLGLFFLKHHSRFLGAAFLLNIGIFVVAFVLVASGVRFTPILLFAADIYWLNLYLIGTLKYFHINFPPGSERVSGRRGGQSGPPQVGRRSCADADCPRMADPRGRRTACR